MKNLITTAFIAMYLLPVFGQYTFHKLVYFEFPATRFSSVLPTDSCYYVTGTFTDSLSPVRAGVLFAKLGLNGELLFMSSIKNPNYDYYYDFSDILQAPGGNLLKAGGIIKPDNTVSLLAEYSLDGDTILIKEYNGILYPDITYHLVKGIISTPENGYAIIQSHDAHENPQDVDISLLIIDSLLNEKYYKRYGTSTWHELARTLILEQDFGYLLGAERTNLGKVNINYENRTLLIKTDSLGNQQWQWLSPEGVLQDGAHAMIKTPDGGLVVASGQGQEIGNNPNIHTLVWDALIFKLDADHNVVWSTPFRGGLPTGQTKLTEMVEATDGNGYVASGIFLEYISDVEWYHTSWLVKVSPEGDSLWARRYTYFDGEFVAPEVWDMKATPDGGYVLVGTAPQVFDINTNPYIPAWIMKVDSFGCLIPGCQLDDTTAVSGSPEQTARLAIFPNPASDFLHFELRSTPTTGTYTARIVDANGKTITEIPAVSAHTTYTLPVWQWPPGVYFLQLLHDGLPVRTERFVVGR